MRLHAYFLFGFFLLFSLVPARSWSGSLGEALTFHVSFDEGVDADLAKGEKGVYTTPTGEWDDGQPGLHREDLAIAEGEGKYGAALHYPEKKRALIFYRGKDNIQYRESDWSGTVSMWLRLDPDEDLQPGYCDPIQITDSAWNDGCLFVDFSKDSPREFRLGAYPEFSVWNPDNTSFNEIPPEDLPLVVVKKPPFRRHRWIHVAIVFTNFNSPEKEGAATLYLDGKRIGSEKRKPMTYVWDPEKSVIQLGYNYVGYMDDVAVFNRALGEGELAELMGLSDGVSSLYED